MFRQCESIFSICVLPSLTCRDECCEISKILSVSTCLNFQTLALYVCAGRSNLYVADAHSLFKLKREPAWLVGAHKILLVRQNAR